MRGGGGAAMRHRPGSACMCSTCSRVRRAYGPAVHPCPLCGRLTPDNPPPATVPPGCRVCSRCHDRADRHARGFIVPRSWGGRG